MSTDDFDKKNNSEQHAELFKHIHKLDLAINGMPEKLRTIFASNEKVSLLEKSHKEKYKDLDNRLKTLANTVTGIIIAVAGWGLITLFQSLMDKVEAFF